MAALALAACGGGGDGDTEAIGPARSTDTTAPTTAASPPTTAALDSPERISAEIESVERAIHDPATPDAAMDDLGQAQQRAYRELLAHPEWEAEALARLPAEVRGRAEAHLAAGRDLSALAGTVDPDDPLPRWRIVAPEPADTLLGHYRAAGAEIAVPWQYLAAIHLVETRMGRIRGDSSAGAQGPMQFIPSTWEIYGEGGDVGSTRDSIYAAARLLRANGAPTDMASALYSYNPSNRYVRAVTVYARQMEANERTYLAYHGWQVYYGSTLLPEGTVIP